MFSIGSHGLEHLDLINLAQPLAELLCENLGETVHMGILEDDHAVYVLKKESSYTLRMYSRVGKMIPLYCTAIGKILLSDMPD
jgi:IclR family KDG regulon transcriptional repressor